MNLKMKFSCFSCRSLILLFAVFSSTVFAQTNTDKFDHSIWSNLLKNNVVLLRAGQGSQVDYSNIAKGHSKLITYLKALSKVNKASFTKWSKPAQQAFLINAYNAFTVELILSKYPNLKSIKDLGGFLSSPWGKKWIKLFGNEISLDDIEHKMLRATGVYDDPRVHFAVNCASVGCPMLREEAYSADKLDRQLSSQAMRFMSDRTRNRFNSKNQTLELSKIFDWYGKDFNLGHKGIKSLADFCASYADKLTDNPEEQQLISNNKANIDFISYDWALNKKR